MLCTGSELFEIKFVHLILDLQMSHPEDSTTDTGGLFWVLPKRFPEPLVFDVNDSIHMSFIEATANLRAQVMPIYITAHTHKGCVKGVRR